MKRKLYSLLACHLFLSASCSSKAQNAGIEDVQKMETADLYLHLVDHPESYSTISDELQERWKPSHAALALEILRFTRDSTVSAGLHSLVSKKTKVSFPNMEGWQNWLWAQDYEPLPTYPGFKAALYRKIDPDFEAYFQNDRKATIRLDEVVWGGVIQDGIPPLRSPKMISAVQAGYLAPDDVVFGIEVNGEFRAYPNRILAWHEMFVDTIQGVPLAGVY